MTIDYPRAKKLCTETEFKLLSSVKPGPLSRMEAAALRKLSGQLRKHSDKWLQQSRRQGNSSTGAAANSQVKHEMFKEALTRVEAKLLKSAVPAKQTVKAAVKKAAPKNAAPKKAPAKKAAPKKVPAKKAAAKKKPSASLVGKKAPSARDRGAMTLAAQAKQKGRITSKRIASSGFTTRMRGHVSASGRRNQAARSARRG